MRITESRRKEIEKLVAAPAEGSWAPVFEVFDSVPNGAKAIAAFLERSSHENESNEVFAVVSLALAASDLNLPTALQLDNPELLYIVAVCGFGKQGKRSAVLIAQMRQAVLELLAENKTLREELREAS